MNPKVAIVILNWNGRKYLEQFLPSVIQSDYSNLEIVIADNGSTDDSIAYIKEHFPFIRLIQFPENFGFAKGYNEALKQIKAEYFVLLNSDVETTRNWINPVIQLMQADASIGVCQPKILMYSDRSHFEYAGGAGGWLDYLGYPFARGRVFDICEQDTGQYDETAPVFWASGAAMFVRADLYNQLNGLDEYFFAHQEELSPATVRRAATEVGEIGGFDAQYAKAMEEVKADAKAGGALGVRKTPTFFVNGRRLEGGLPPNYFENVLEIELKRAR